ncbi:MAG: DNA alkylation repair protein [Candidatus Moranbacteria bacterium]|nr:DNA alkylation repair protein [Candidatus Moranbacteria bacterium]
MELMKQMWTKEDGEEFQQFLIGCGRPEKVEWTKKIINTQMPVLAVLSPIIKDIIKKILKGNFVSFVDLWLWDCFENTSVNGGLIMKMKDFNMMKSYLLPFCERADNWATCDLLTFAVDEKNEKHFWNLSLELVGSDKLFMRRVGVNICFKFIEREGFLPKIFDRINGMRGETEYYVNMVAAWLIAECFAKKREETLAFLKTNKLNDFTANKSVSKCRDSFRVSKEDKELLLQFKR